MTNLGSNLTKAALRRIAKRRKEMHLSQATLASYVCLSATSIRLTSHTV